MQRSSLIMMFVSMFALVLTGCGTTKPAPTVSGGQGTEPVELLRQTSGSDAAFAKIGSYLLNSADDSKANLEALAPNYETESVIVVSLGEVPTGGFGVTITGVQKKGDKIFVQFTTTQPGSDAVVTQAFTQPYAAVAVPKLTGTIFLEESN